MTSKILRVVLSIYLVISVVFYAKVINHDYIVGNFMKQNDRTQFREIINGVPIYRTISEVVVHAYNENIFPRNCENLNYLSDRLLEMNPRSSYAFYMRSACNEISGNIEFAILEMKKAAKFDRQNPDFKFSLAVLFFNANNYEESSAYLRSVKKTNPNYPNLKVLEQRLQIAITQESK
jgi:tetratricopeptide (TPR) repeat protein